MIQDRSDKDVLWHAVYTYPRAEKKVVRRLKRSDIQAYLPLRTVKRKWSDRTAHVEEPLFPNYVFVNVNEAGVLKTLRTNGVSRFVSFNNRRAIIPEDQIETIRWIVRHSSLAGVISDLKTGEPVRIKRGPLEGMEGVCLEDGNRQQMYVQIEAIRQSIRLSISPHDLERIES